MNYKCRFCGKQFQDHRILSGHAPFCQKNPNVQRNKINCSNQNNQLYGCFKYFDVKCYTCGKDLKIRQRQKTFPKKEKYFCNATCVRSYRGSKTKNRQYKNNWNILNPQKFRQFQQKGIKRAQQKRKQVRQIRWSKEHVNQFPVPTSKYHLRKYLLVTCNYTCQFCGFHLDVLDDTMKGFLLDVHHIDGNKHNNDLQNLIVICKNCHSLTRNYAFNGRHHSQENKKKCVNDRFN